jgi:hypothetical protein
MPVSAATESLRGQYLHVTIDIPTRRWRKFKSLMKGLLPVFTGPVPENGEVTGFGWDLEFAMTQKGDATTRIRHLWRMTDPQRPLLWEAMSQLGTEDSYGDLDELVDVEVQDIMHSDGVYSPRELPAEAPKFFAHEEFELSRDPGAVTEFVDGMPVLAYDAQEKCGWTLALGLEVETGKLRRYVNLWQIKDASPAATRKATRWLKRQDLYRLVASQKIETWKALTYES